MSASLNAIGILLVVIFTCIMLYRCGSRELTFRRTVIAFFIMLATIMLHAVFSVTMCGRGNPFFQWLVPSISIFFVISGLTNQSIRRKTALALFIASIVLSFQYKYLVKVSGYTGALSIHFDRQMTCSMDSALSLLENKVRTQGNEKSRIKYPAGWLIEIFPEIDTYYCGSMLYQTNRDEMWHSDFTGLYTASRGERLELWYKGGYLKDIDHDSVEFREYNIRSRSQSPL